MLVSVLSTAICASDVHSLDHPEAGIDDPSGRSRYDPERDVVLGHEFVGEVLTHGPGCTGRFPVGTRVTSIPIRLVDGGAGGTRIIGQHPDSPGSFAERLACAGGWYTGDTLDITAATRTGVNVQFGGGPMPEDWYGTLDAITAGILDPLPSIGAVIGLEQVPDALDQVRRSRGPARVVVHPNGDPR